jgi:hypothetical protein
MIRLPQKLLRTFCSFLLLQSLAVAQSPTSHSWKSDQRILLGLEIDDNIAESLSLPKSDGSLVLTYENKSVLHHPNSSLLLTYSGGLQLYQNYGSENKSIHEASTKFQYYYKRVSLGLHALGKSKYLFDKNGDYGLLYVNPFARLSLNKRLALLPGFKYETLKYAHYSDFNYAGEFFSLLMTANIHQNISVNPEASFGSIHLNRPAYRLMPPDQWVPQDVKHQDDYTNAGLLIDWYSRGLLVNVGYYFQTAKSNSDGFSFAKHLVKLIIVKQLGRYFIKGFCTLEKKNYTDKTVASLPTDIDTERRQSNCVVLDLSRDIRTKTTLTLRMAWYTNESLLPQKYYQKTLVNFLIDFHY